jgi:hypothetical protein
MPGLAGVAEPVPVLPHLPGATVISSPRENSVHGPVDLTEKALAALGDQVIVPTYNRSALQPAVVHFGVGGFHRAR